MKVQSVNSTPKTTESALNFVINPTISRNHEDIRYLKPDDSSFSLLVYGIIYPQIIVFTFATNILICIVLLRKNMRSPTNTLLVAMAISDMLTGLTGLPVYIRFYTTGLNEYVPYDWCWLYLYLSNYIPTIFHTASVWLTVALAIHRYVSVCHSQAAKRLCSKRNTVFVVVIVYLAAAFSQMSRFFECTYLPYPINLSNFSVGHSRNDSSFPNFSNSNHDILLPSSTYNTTLDYGSYGFGDLNSSDAIVGCIEVPNDFIAAYDHLYFVSYYIARLVLIHFIPCGLLIVLNAMLVQTMRQARKRRSQLIKQNRKNECRRLTESNLTTLMLVSVVGLFLLVEVPMAVVFIIMMVDNIFSLGLLSDHLHYAVPQWINFFILISYPFNFFIYCAMSHQFRNTFKELFCCCCCPKKDERLRNEGRSQDGFRSVGGGLASSKHRKLRETSKRL